ncbi:MAG: hypothetical protein BJ554DRAFT_2124, partial [Olpidium bornovanus]
VLKKARKSSSRGSAVSVSSAGTERAHAARVVDSRLFEIYIFSHPHHTPSSNIGFKAEDWAPGTEREPHHHIPPVIRNLLHVPKPFKTLKYSASKKHKNLKQLLASEKAAVNVDVPTREYTDPKTRLRYHNLDVYQHIRGLNQNVVQEHLLLRNAAFPPRHFRVRRAAQTSKTREELCQPATLAVPGHFARATPGRVLYTAVDTRKRPHTMHRTNWHTVLERRNARRRRQEKADRPARNEDHADGFPDLR